MERWFGRIALVTGASAGIGAAVAKRLVSYGMKVVGCCEKDISVFETISLSLASEKGQFIPIKCDLRKEQDILDMFHMIKCDFGGVDVCVNNAGIAHCAPLLSGKTEDWREMLDVNVIGGSICTREAIKQMRGKGADDGHVFLLNSLVGHRVIPWTDGHFYSATKFAISALRDGIRNELRELNSNIRVTCISPGIVETNFSAAMNKDEQKAKDLHSSFKCLQPDDIADSLIYALSAPPHVQVHDILIRSTEQVL